MSQIRMQNHFGAVRSEERYSVDADLLREIKQASSSDGSVMLTDVFLCLPALALQSCFAGGKRLSSILQHLKQEQEGLSHLISVIKDDMEDIKLIEHGLQDGVHVRAGILS